jgi:hypothetical protein
MDESCQSIYRQRKKKKNRKKNKKEKKKEEAEIQWKGMHMLNTVKNFFGFH